MSPGGPARLTCTKHAAGRLCRWTGRKSSCSGRWRSGISASCGCGLPTCSGYLKSVAVAPAELEGAFAEGIGFDGSAIEGFSRVYEADMLAKPDPATFQLMPAGGESAGHGPDVLRHPAARRLAQSSPTRGTCSSAPWPARPGSASPSTPTRRSSSSCSGSGPSRGASRGRSTPAATSTTPRTASRTTSAARRSRCWRGWASRWSSATTRARPASRRSTCATPTR